MLRNIIQAVFLAIILTSCQREVSIIQRIDSDPLLVKIIAVTAPQNDSSIITYDYNNNGQLIKETFLVRYLTASGSISLPSWLEFTRDPRGRITQIKGVGRSVVNPTVDIISFGTVYYINDTSTQVAYITNDQNDNKTIFLYNNAGQVVRTEDYQRLQPTDPLRMVVYHLYQYDVVGNLIERKEYTDHDNNGSFEFNLGARMLYDGKVNPVFRMDDALLEGRWLDYSPENFLKMFIDNPYPMSIQDTVINQFTYRADGRPQTVFVSGNSISSSTRTYFYQ